MSNTKASSRLTCKFIRQDCDWNGKPKVGVVAIFDIEGRPEHRLSVTTSKGYSGQIHTTATIVKMLGPFEVSGSGGTSKTFPYSKSAEIKRCTQKTATLAFDEGTNLLYKAIDEGAFDLDGKHGGL